MSVLTLKQKQTQIPCLYAQIWSNKADIDSLMTIYIVQIKSLASKMSPPNKSCS